MRWTGNIPAGTTCTELAATIDILPTFAALAGAPVPSDRIIDGKDIRPLLFGEPGSEVPSRSVLLLLEHRPSRRSPAGLGKKTHFPHSYRSLKGKRWHRGKPHPTSTRRSASHFPISSVTSAKRRTSRRSIPTSWPASKSWREAAREDLGHSLTRPKAKRPPAGEIVIVRNRCRAPFVRPASTRDSGLGMPWLTPTATVPVHAPIPENEGRPFDLGLELRYGEVLPALHRFCGAHERDSY